VSAINGNMRQLVAPWDAFTF